jgi:hypothetical protein
MRLTVSVTVCLLDQIYIQERAEDGQTHVTLSRTRSNPPDPHITPPPSSDMRPRRVVHEPYVSPMMVPKDSRLQEQPPALQSPSKVSPPRTATPTASLVRSPAQASPERGGAGRSPMRSPIATAFSTTPKDDWSMKDREITDALARAHIQVATLSRYVHETQETVEMTSVRVASNLANLASREDSSQQLPRHVHDLQYVQTFSSPVVKSPAPHMRPSRPSPRLLPKESVLSNRHPLEGVSNSNMTPPGLKSASGAQENRQGGRSTPAAHTPTMVYTSNYCLRSLDLRKCPGTRNEASGINWACPDPPRNPPQQPGGAELRAVASADGNGQISPTKKTMQGTYEQLVALYVCSGNLFGAGTQ